MAIKSWQGESVTIKVDYEKCNGNGECAESCPSEVYQLQSNKSVAVNIDACIECCTCVDVCPQAAIIHSACQ